MSNTLDDERLEKDIDSTNNNIPPSGGGDDSLGPYVFAKAVIEELKFMNFPFANGIILKCDDYVEGDARIFNPYYITRTVLGILRFDLALMYSEKHKGRTTTLENRVNSAKDFADRICEIYWHLRDHGINPYLEDPEIETTAEPLASDEEAGNNDASNTSPSSSDIEDDEELIDYSDLLNEDPSTDKHTEDEPLRSIEDTSVFESIKEDGSNSITNINKLNDIRAFQKRFRKISGILKANNEAKFDGKNKYYVEILNKIGFSNAFQCLYRLITDQNNSIKRNPNNRIFFVMMTMIYYLPNLSYYYLKKMHYYSNLDHRYIHECIIPLLLAELDKSVNILVRRSRLSGVARATCPD